MNIEHIPKYLAVGDKYRDWYTDCRKLFVELFGEEEVELVCNLFAATSINTSMKGNITLFRRAYYEIKNDLPVGKYLPNIQRQIEQIRRGDELTGRKIRSFAHAMMGDKNAVVVDVWLLRAFEEERKSFRKLSQREQSSGATDKQYTMIENYIREEAPKLDLYPAQMSAMIWSGARIVHNGEVDNTYEQLLRFKMNNLFNVI